jgi:SulP family sulfate permease
LTEINIIERKQEEHAHLNDLPSSVMIYDINGPLFFGSAQKALKIITNINPEIRVVILDMSDVTMLDMTAIVAMESIVTDLKKRSLGLVINNLQPRMLLKLRRAGVRKESGVLEFSRTMDEAVTISVKNML